MSGRHKRTRQTEPAEREGLWVRTEPRVEGGGYFVTVSWEQDRIWRLDADACLNYVLACTMAAQHAEYDAAILKQLTSIGVPLIDAAAVLANEIRPDRRPLPDAAPGLRYEPGVTEAGKPFLKVVIDGQADVATLDLDQIRRHAQYVLEAPVAADLDSGYRQALIGLLGIEPARADNVVGDLAKHRWTPRRG